MDDPSMPEDVLVRVLHDLTRIHSALGNTRAIVRRLASDPKPVRRVLDIGCGGGQILAEIRRRMHTDVIGVELRPPKVSLPGVPIIEADAVRDRLPEADVAISICVVHHLTEEAFAAMIHNVGRSCRRFIVLDLVRHHVPLWLFRVFVAPWIHPVNVHDGMISIRRAFKPDEMRRLLEKTLNGTAATFDLRVAPFYTRQIADIRY